MLHQLFRGCLVGLRDASKFFFLGFVFLLSTEQHSPQFFGAFDVSNGIHAAVFQGRFLQQHFVAQATHSGIFLLESCLGLLQSTLAGGHKGIEFCPFRVQLVLCRGNRLELGLFLLRQLHKLKLNFFGALLDVSKFFHVAVLLGHALCFEGALACLQAGMFLTQAFFFFAALLAQRVDDMFHVRKNALKAVALGFGQLGTLSGFRLHVR